MNGVFRYVPPNCACYQLTEQWCRSCKALMSIICFFSCYNTCTGLVCKHILSYFLYWNKCCCLPCCFPRNAAVSPLRKNDLEPVKRYRTLYLTFYVLIRGEDNSVNIPCYISFIKRNLGAFRAVSPEIGVFPPYGTMICSRWSVYLSYMLPFLF